MNDRGVRITKQAVSEKRQFIDPQVYIDMNDSLISKIYAHKDEMTTFKGFNINAIDGSIVEIPNTKITREEFEIPERFIDEDGVDEDAVSDWLSDETGWLHDGFEIVE